MTTPFIAGDQLVRKIAIWHAEAQDGSIGEGIRADSLIRSEDVEAQSIALRAHVREQYHRIAFEQAQRRGDSVRIDAKERDRAVAAATRRLAKPLGLSVQDGEVRHDSHFLPGELTAKSGRGTIVARQVPNVMLRAMPVLPVPAWMQYISDEYLGYEGAAGVHQPGQTQYPRAGFKRQEGQQEQLTLVIETEVDWAEALFGGSAGINVAARKAEAARRAIEKLANKMLVEGYAGTNFKGLSQLNIPEYISAVTFDGDQTLEDQYAEIIAARHRIDNACEDRNLDDGEINTIMVGAQLHRKLMSPSNYGSGGSSDGVALMRRTLDILGIDNVIKAPELDSLKDGYSSMLFFSPGDQDGLKHLQGMGVAPVGTDTSGYSNKTLFAMRSAGLSLPSALRIGLAHFKLS